jgi:eukaryotic-like serine/threonine-protein kinase
MCINYLYSISGRSFEDGLGTVALLHKILTEQPKPPSLFNPSIPPELDQVVMKCLELKRENRFATAEDLISELKEVRHTLPEAST